MLLLFTLTLINIFSVTKNITTTKTPLYNEIYNNLKDSSFCERHKISQIHLASLGNSPILLESLIDGGANIESKNEILSTPIHYAALRSNTDCLSILLRRGANKEAKDYRGYTPLLIAAKSGNILAVDVLLQHGANPHTKTNDGKGIFELSSKYPFIHILIKSYQILNNDS